MSTCPAEPICDTDTFKADPDIAGIGVILAFLISAWSSLLIVTADYISTPEGEPLVLLDAIFSGYIRKLIEKPWPLESIRPVVQMMSDQQLVTGTAILSVGYIQHCTITQYHFFIVYLLGFISCQVYDASLNTLHGRIGKRPIMKLWRAILMTALFGMVILNTFVTDHDDFLYYYGASTQCVWNKFIGVGHYRSYTLDLFLSLALLSWEYFECIALIYPRISKPVRRALNIFRLWLFCCQGLYSRIERLRSNVERELAKPCHTRTGTRSPTTSIAKLCLGTSINLGLSLIQLFLWTLFLPIFTISEILKSNILNIWRVYSALLWATMIIAETKQEVNSDDLIDGSESDWGFGQLLPLFLLILPVMAIVELFQGTQGPGDEEAKNTIACPKCQHQISLLSNDTSRYEEAARVPSGPTNNTESTESKDFQLNRQDTEARVGFSDSSTADTESKTNDPAHVKLNLQERMHESAYFRVFLVLCALAAFGGSTYGAIMGYAY
ncbi:hypothetical protein F4818DRAFT_33796 [Hypoxylon cercidicola]|nr:hypothetical protein F4818DRAFT_33796 [Hypoxylon cercidicola]